jgi:hypothetical protein
MLSNSLKAYTSGEHLATGGFSSCPGRNQYLQPLIAKSQRLGSTRPPISLLGALTIEVGEVQGGGWGREKLRRGRRGIGSKQCEIHKTATKNRRGCYYFLWKNNAR